MPPLPYEKLIELLASNGTSPGKKTTQPRKTVKSSTKSPLAPRRSNNGIRKTSPSLKKSTPSEKPAAHLDMKSSVEKPGTIVQSFPTPPISNGDDKSTSLRRVNQENIEAPKQPRRKSEMETKGLHENAKHQSQRHAVPHKISNSARRSSWPQICKDQGPRGLCMWICSKRVIQTANPTDNPHNYCYRRSVLQALVC